jgi:hypothetical protein
MPSKTKLTTASLFSYIFFSLFLVLSLSSCGKSIDKQIAKSIDEQIADCQCEKFETLAKKLEANPEEADKSLAYMADILDCIAPHLQKMQVMNETQLKELQKNIDLHVSKKCATAFAKLKNR